MTQFEILKSLGEAISWLEREKNWNVNLGELRHLTGRIGELYVALITNGNMAMNLNEKGYDVVSKQGERISVKTTTMTSGHGHVAFNPNTLNVVDRVIIVGLNKDELEMEIFYDGLISDAITLMDNKFNISLSKIIKKKNSEHQPAHPQSVISCAQTKDELYQIDKLENGTIVVYKGGILQENSYSNLIEIAKSIGVSLYNTNGNKMNTRQLGDLLIKRLT